jgi:hypothetical protein
VEKEVASMTVRKSVSKQLDRGRLPLRLVSGKHAAAIGGTE